MNTILYLESKGLLVYARYILHWIPFIPRVQRSEVVNFSRLISIRQIVRYVDTWLYWSEEKKVKLKKKG